MSNCNMAHKPISISKAMSILEAKATFHKEWTKLENLPADAQIKIRRQECSFCNFDGRCVNSRTPNWRRISKSTKENWC